VTETYAIIKDSGRELKVREGEKVLVDLRPIEFGDEITFPDVLLLSSPAGVQVGQPVLDGASVVGEVTRQVAMEKLHPYKFRRRKGYHRKIGHRQKMLEVLVRTIQPGASA
jgi:large subunit ribosomal protein L21